MARTDNLNNFLTDVADSIRTKTGKTDKIKASSFDTEIESIETGGGEPTLEEVTTTITSNTTTVITPSEGYDGIGKATIVTNVDSSSGRIPSKYQEVEYIGKSSATASYIDTKYKPTYNTKVVATASIFSGFLCGQDSGWSTSGFGILKNYSYFSNKWSSVSITTDVHNFITSKDGYYVDDVLKDSFSGAAVFTGSYSLHIYSNNRNGSPSEYGYGNIYTFKIYESDELQRDFVPCYEKSTNNIGLYDLITKEFYPTSGTGTWIKGDDVNPTPELNLQDKEITITKNGTTSVTYDSDYDGLGKVDITTSVAGTGSSITITDGNYLFYQNARVEQFSDIFDLCDNLQSIYYMFYNASNISTAVDLSDKLASGYDHRFDNAFSGASKIPSIKINVPQTTSTSLSQTFSGCTNLTSIDLTGFNLNKITNLQRTFANCNNLTTIEGFFDNDLSNVTTLQNTFDSCKKLETIDLSGQTMDKLTTMESAFANTTNAKVIKFPKTTTAKVTSMYTCFYNDNNIETLDMSGFKIGAITSAKCMFGSSTNRDTSIEGTVEIDFGDQTFPKASGYNFTILFQYNKFIKKVNLNFMKTLTYTQSQFDFMFQGASSLVELDLTPIVINKTGLTTLRAVFDGCARLASITTIENIVPTKLSGSYAIQYLFRDCKSLTSIDLSAFDTTYVTQDSNSYYWGTSGYSSMFEGCESLQTLDISHFVIGTSIKAFQKTFYNCKSLTSLTLPNMSSNTIEQMYQVFYNVGVNNTDCTINIKDILPISNISDWRYCFYGCGSKDLNISSSTTAISHDNIDISYMYSNCKNVLSLDLRWVKSINNGQYLCDGCDSLEEVDISNVYNVSYDKLNYAFQNCPSLKTIKLHHSSTEPLFARNSYLYGPTNMFYKCTNLEVLDFRYAMGDSAGTTQMSYGNNTFAECRKLRKLDLRGNPGYGSLGPNSSSWNSGAVKAQTFLNCGADNDTPTIVYVDTEGTRNNIIQAANSYGCNWSEENVIVVSDPEEEVDMS